MLKIWDLYVKGLQGPIWADRFKWGQGRAADFSLRFPTLKGSKVHFILEWLKFEEPHPIRYSSAVKKLGWS